MRLDAATAAYLRALEGASRSPETIQNGATYLTAFARAAFEDDDPDVATIEPAHIEAWVAEMRGRELRSSSISTAVSSLSAFLRWCENQGHLSASPMRRVLRPSSASSVDDDYAYLDDDQLELLLRVARDGWDPESAGTEDTRDASRRAEDFLICVLMGLAGLRVSEV
jgi:site-specific recombinase XerC